ncbi:hypothetical protein TNCV_3549561 [Trichonephila clavipes]|nr:hypothetical protein TNCV_3549561 [Trichonephila clavipes]
MVTLNFSCKGRVVWNMPVGVTSLVQPPSGAWLFLVYKTSVSLVEDLIARISVVIRENTGYARNLLEHKEFHAAFHAEIVEGKIEVVSPSIVPSWNFAELNRTVTCMVLKANNRRTSNPYYDEFCGPRSDYVRQWDRKGPVYYELLKQGKTINEDLYCNQLDKLNAAMKEKKASISVQKRNSVPPR